MATQTCEPCTIVPCLPEDDFFIPAPPVPPPVPTTRVTVCNTPQTVECPDGKIGYAVTIPACTYSQTLIFQAGTSQATKDALIAQVQANLDATALAAAQHQISCHDVGPPPPPPTKCKKIPDDFVWGSCAVIDNAGGSASCSPSTAANQAVIDMAVSLPAAPPFLASENCDIVGAWTYFQDATTNCQFQIKVDILQADGVDGDANAMGFGVEYRYNGAGPYTVLVRYTTNPTFFPDPAFPATPSSITYGPITPPIGTTMIEFHVALGASSLLGFPGNVCVGHTVVTISKV